MSNPDNPPEGSARPERNSPTSAARFGALAGLVAVIAAYLVLSFGSAREMSVTVDELGHLPSGVYTLVTGDARYSALNPPLANALSALPVLSMNLGHDVAPPEPSEDVFSFWPAGYQFLERHRDDYVRIFAVARVVPILLLGLLGGLLFVWASRLDSASPAVAGVLAAALVLGSPNVIAHARLVGTDTATAVFVSLAIFLFREMLQRPSMRSAVIFGVALGLAQLTKFYALLLYPVLFASVFAWLWLSGAKPSERAPMLRAFSIAVGVSGFVLNGGYLFAEFGSSLGELQVQSAAFKEWQGGFLGSLPLPVPGAFVRAIDGQWFEVSSGLRSFLWGESFQGGRWDYYLVLLAIKTPLPLFAAFACAVATQLRASRIAHRETMLLLGYPVVLIALLSLSGSRQLGARALLSAVPLVELWVACHFVGLWPERWRARVSGIAIVSILATSALAYPNYLSYFNPLVGGSQNGYRYASDANVDIGQDLPALARFLDDVDAGTVQLFYFGSVDPALYGIDYVVPETYQLAPGYVAISVSLYRMDYPLYDHGTLRRMGPIDVSILGEPVAKLGGSIHVFRVPERDAGAH